ncbi:MAG: type II toxin-antitoxin system RelE/ParE family toxin [Clostridia bacterium]|nr:type II toxin-antitoxin system RelE/ParE family toxin [Clostridia bacterium]
MKKYKIIWSPKAYMDLQNIHFYIEYYLREKITANNVVKRILDSISNLSYLPEKYVKLKNFNDKTKNLRKMPINNYLVIYEINNNTRTSLHFTYFSWKPKLFKQIIVKYYFNQITFCIFNY